MPTYTFKNKKTGKYSAPTLLTISEMEAFEKANPEWEAMCGAPVLGYNVYSMNKKPEWIKDKLKAIKDDNPGSTIEI